MKVYKKKKSKEGIPQAEKGEGISRPVKPMEARLGSMY